MAKRQLPGKRDATAVASRREFLKGATALATGMVVRPVGQEESAAILPAVSLASHRVTRLIVGSNPVYGYSHFNRLLTST